MGAFNPYDDTVVIKSGPALTTQVEQPTSILDSLSSVWHDMGTSVSGAWNDAENYVESAWDTTKLTAYGAYLTAGEVVDETKESIKETISGATNIGDSFISWLQGKLIFIIGIGLVVIVVLAKTGILPQIADTVRAIYGG